MARVLLSSYRVRSAAPAGPAGPVLWPRYVVGPGGMRTLAMVPIPPERIPPGWQNVAIRVPMRLATCEEVECPMFLAGWTEIRGHDGNTIQRVGKLSVEEAAGITGYYGAQSLPPMVAYHPEGLDCGRVHKVPSGLPPIYRVNGRTVLWTEFEDAIGGGVHQTQRIKQAG